MTPGTLLQAPDGRRYVVGVQTGVGPVGEPLVRVVRADRRKGEVMNLWKRVDEVQAWGVAHG
jgi:hypothetical protein